MRHIVSVAVRRRLVDGIHQLRVRLFMADTQTIPYAGLRPPTTTRSAWNQVLVEGQPAAVPLAVDCTGLSRLDAGFLAALGPAEQERRRRGGSLRIIAADDHQRTLLRLLGYDRLLTAVSGSLAQDLSCQVSCTETEAIVRIQTSALQNERLSLPASYAWIRCLAVERLIIDLEQLPHINSVLVAWILQLGQAAKPAVITLRNVNRQVNIQLTQLRLHHLLTVESIP